MLKRAQIRIGLRWTTVAIYFKYDEGDNLYEHMAYFEQDYGK